MPCLFSETSGPLALRLSGAHGCLSCLRGVWSNRLYPESAQAVFADLSQLIAATEGPGSKCLCRECPGKARLESHGSVRHFWCDQVRADGVVTWMERGRWLLLPLVTTDSQG